MVAGLILSRWRRGRAKGSLAGASGAFLAWCGAPGPSEGRSLRGERGQGGGRPFGRMTRAERVAEARVTAVSGPCPVPPRFPSLAPGRGTVPAPFLWWALWHFSPPLCILFGCFILSTALLILSPWRWPGRFFRFLYIPLRGVRLPFFTLFLSCSPFSWSVNPLFELSCFLFL